MLTMSLPTLQQVRFEALKPKVQGQSCVSVLSELRASGFIFKVHTVLGFSAVLFVSV